MRKILIGVLLLLSVSVGAFAGPPSVPSSATASNASTLEGHAASYFQVDLGLVAGTLTQGKFCTYDSGALVCDSDGGTGATIDDTKGNGDTAYVWSADKVYDQLALKQPLDSSLTALSELSSPITIDGNNITVPGALITTAADGQRKNAVLANTVGVDPTSDAFEMYPDSDDTWKINQHGTEYTFVLNGLASTNLILPSSNADDSNAASDGSIKVFTGNHVNTLVSATAVADDSYTIITKTEYIPIAYAENGAAAPAAASVWADTRKAKIRVFAADADDDVEIHWMVPDDYVGGIKFRVVGFVDNATAPADTETVIFNLAGCSVGNSDDGGCTLGTGVDSTFTADATYAQHDRWSSAWSNEITVTNIVAGESAMLKLFRDVDDTYGQGIGVAGIEIKYKARVLMADRY